MAEQKSSGAWVRLDHTQREEIEKEAQVTGYNMSEIIRQRLFNDPIARIDNRMYRLEQRSLTQAACSNLIIEILESLFPEDRRIGKKGIQARIDTLKGLVIKAENARMRLEIEDDEER